MARATRPTVLIRLLERVWPDHQVEKMGQEHMVLCPFCDTSKAKLAVNPEKGVFQCWVCGERGPISKLLHHLQTLSLIKPTDVKAVMTGGIVSRLTDAIGTHTKDVTKEKQYWSVTSPCVYPPRVFPISKWSPRNMLEGRMKNAAINYVAGRGLKLEDIERYRLAVCCSLDSIYHGHIFIPALGPHGRQLVFWTTRAMSPIVDPKSLHAGKKYSRFSAKHILMNEHFITGDEVAICEGPFDAFSVMANTGIPAVPLLGKVFHPYHRTALREKGIKKVYICLDSDATTKAEGLARSLEAHGFAPYVVYLEDGDPNDVTPDELRAAFEKATLELIDELTSVTDALH